MLRFTKDITLAALLGGATLLGACSKDNNSATDTTAATTTTDTTAMAPAAAGSTSAAGAMNAPANGPMTDPQIFAALHEANQGEIAAGKMAESKATNAGVKAFARMMVADHTTMLHQGDALAKRLNITPAAAPGDSIPAQNQAMATTLTSAAKGAPFDSAYVNGQVAGHQQVLDMLKGMEGKSSNAQVNSLIKGAETKVQAHLDRAKALQGKVG